MNEQFFEETRRLIERAYTLKALEKLNAACKKEGLDDFYDVSTQLITTQNKLDRDKMLGIVSNSEENARSNKITWDAIKLLNQIKRGNKVSEIEPSELEELVLEKNITKKIKEIYWLESGLHCALSVCMVLVNKKDRFGDYHQESATGFLVNSNRGLLLMTNHHVVSKKEELGDVKLVFGHQRNRHKVIEGEIKYKADTSFYCSNEKLDYAVFLVKDHNETLQKWNALSLLDEIDDNTIFKKNHVTIIQHPLGNEKRIALNENQITKVNENSIDYLTDTEHGSSGSPVFNDDWKVIALHRGHKLVKTRKNRPYYNNGGTLILKIKEDLAEKGIHLLQPVEK